jgi:RimJ/RimL family protein N-acetyltransferase
MEVRPWRAGDQALLVAAQPDLSPESLTSRFFTGLRTLPVKYLRYVAHAPRNRWDAQVAIYEGRLIGWAEVARSIDAHDEADVAVLVADAWQRRGVATALFRALLPRAAAAGVRLVHAHVDPTNVAARATIRKVGGGAWTARFEDGLVRYTMRL